MPVMDGGEARAVPARQARQHAQSRSTGRPPGRARHALSPLRRAPEVPGRSLPVACHPRLGHPVSRPMTTVLTARRSSAHAQGELCMSFELGVMRRHERRSAYFHSGAKLWSSPRFSPTLKKAASSPSILKPVPPRKVKRSKRLWPTSATGLERARAVAPDLILMDSVMPVMDGGEARAVPARQARQHAAHSHARRPPGGAGRSLPPVRPAAALAGREVPVARHPRIRETVPVGPRCNPRSGS